jgi:hypothetical protein
MKKLKVSRIKSITETSIDQYCKSVAELLSNINEKEGSRPRSKIQDESEDMDYSEESYIY